MPKVWLYKDKTTGEFNGDATITYEDPFAAMSAPKWFDGREFKGLWFAFTGSKVYLDFE
jgi:hypothetical protein